MNSASLAHGRIARFTVCNSRRGGGPALPHARLRDLASNAVLTQTEAACGTAPTAWVNALVVQPTSCSRAALTRGTRSVARFSSRYSGSLERAVCCSHARVAFLIPTFRDASLDTARLIPLTFLPPCSTTSSSHAHWRIQLVLPRSQAEGSAQHMIHLQEIRRRAAVPHAACSQSVQAAQQR